MSLTCSSAVTTIVRLRFGHPIDMSSTALLLCGIASFALDQSSKALALAVHRQREPASFAGSFLRCSLNTGVTRRMLGGPGVMVTLWIAEVVALVTLVEVVPAFGGLVPPPALGLALGGAAGNLFDRLLRGGVVDFIDLGFWPVFNLADVAIVAGVLVAVAAVI